MSPNDSNEIIQVEEIEVEPAINDITQQMEEDITKFGENLE